MYIIQILPFGASRWTDFFRKELGHFHNIINYIGINKMFYSIQNEHHLGSAAIYTKCPWLRLATKATQWRRIETKAVLLFFHDTTCEEPFYKNVKWRTDAGEDGEIRPKDLERKQRCGHCAGADRECFSWDRSSALQQSSAFSK